MKRLLVVVAALAMLLVSSDALAGGKGTARRVQTLPTATDFDMNLNRSAILESKFVQDMLLELFRTDDGVYQSGCLSDGLKIVSAGAPSFNVNASVGYCLQYDATGAGDYVSAYRVIQLEDAEAVTAWSANPGAATYYVHVKWNGALSDSMEYSDPDFEVDTNVSKVGYETIASVLVGALDASADDYSITDLRTVLGGTYYQPGDVEIGGDLDVDGDVTAGTVTMTDFSVDASGNAVCLSLDVSDHMSIDSSPSTIADAPIQVSCEAGAADQDLPAGYFSVDNSAGTALTSGGMYGIAVSPTGNAGDGGSAKYVSFASLAAVDSGGSAEMIGVLVGSDYDKGIVIGSGGADITGGLVVDSVTVAQASDSVTVYDDSDTNNAQIYVDNSEGFFFGDLNADCSDTNANSEFPTVGGASVYVEDNNAGGGGGAFGSPIYVLAGELVANLSTGFDAWVVTSGGHLVQIKHNAAAATGTAVYFDDGDSAAERLHVDGGLAVALARSLL